MRILHSVRTSWTSVILGEFTPHDIALGFAFGTAVALLPTFGFSVLLTLVLFVLVPRVNKPAALLALAFWNPLVQIPVYTLSFQFGGILFSGEPILRFDIELLNQVYTFTRRFLVGHLIVSATLALLSYVAVYVLSAAYLPKSARP